MQEMGIVPLVNAYHPDRAQQKASGIYAVAHGVPEDLEGLLVRESERLWR